ncbi:MAG: TonB-dependent receptor plug domain-containing protein [Flavobacteriaceae bacterium]
MRILFIFSLLFCTTFSVAQENQLQPILLLDYISSIEDQSSINFSYDAKLLENVKVIPLESNELTTTIAYLKNNTAFNFKLLDNGTVIVAPYEANKNIKLCIDILDSEFNIPLTDATLTNETSTAVLTYNNEKFIKYVNYTDWKTVRINYLGYKEEQLSIDEFNGLPCKTIYLNPSETILDNVVINYLTSGIRYKNDNQSIEIKVKDAGLLPGETETDIFTSIDALPGINSSNGKAGSLALRGDDPDKTLILYDNIPIYHSGHYFGTFSPYNADLLKSVTINRNGFDAEKGGRISGLIELNTNTKITDSVNHTVGIATSYALANTEIPIIKDKWSIQLGARTSYPFEWNSPKIKAVEDFIFQQSVLSKAIMTDGVEVNNFEFIFSDINLKSNLKINSKNSLSLSLLHIKNDLDLSIQYSKELPSPGGAPPLPINTIDSNIVEIKNTGLNLEFLTQWTPSLLTNSHLTISEFSQVFNGKLAPPTHTIETTKYDNNIKNIILKSTTTKVLNPKSEIDFGFEFNNYNVFNDRLFDNPARTFVEKSHNKEQLYSMFTNFSVNKMTPITLKLGLRGTYYSATKKVYAEPRLMANYTVNKSLKIKTSAGLYNQFISHVSGRRGMAAGVDQFNWKLSNDSNIPVLYGQQVMLGGIFNKNKWLIDFEGYYKQTDNIAVYDLYNYGNTEDFFIGKYNTWGMDLLVRKSWKNIDTWISYSHIKTLANFDDIQEDSFRSVWDQNHILNYVFSFTYKKLKLSTGWKYKTGLASLEDIRDFYINGPFFNQSSVGQTYNDRHDRQYGEQLPDQHQLDISLSYTYQKKTWNAVVGLAATNVYDRKNLIGQKRKPHPGNTYSLANQYSMGFAPSMLIKFNF